MPKRKRTTPLPDEEYDPTPLEILRATLEFQRHWSPQEELRRRLPHLDGDLAVAWQRIEVRYDPV